MPFVVNPTNCPGRAKGIIEIDLVYSDISELLGVKHAERGAYRTLD